MTWDNTSTLIGCYLVRRYKIPRKVFTTTTMVVKFGYPMHPKNFGSHLTVRPSAGPSVRPPVRTTGKPI